MKQLAALFLILLATATLAQPPEVKKAYKDIPHRYTPFQTSKATMSSADKAYLQKNFELVNQAVVARVQTMQSRAYGSYAAKSKPILSALKAQTPPKKLKKYHALVIAAIQDQGSYFAAWSKSKSSKFNARDPKVQGASQKLRAAYSILMREYPKEAVKNKQAFFDHLCALDFI